MLSILIVNWNTKNLLQACLGSIRAHPPSAEYEVVVVDNASSDGSADMVRQEFPEAILVASPQNTGYARGNNLAFQIAKGEFLTTLNPDTEFTDDSLDLAQKTLQDNPKAGCLGIRLVSLDGKTQRSVRGFPTVVGIAGDILRIRKGRFDSYRLTHFDYERLQDAPQPMGSFLMFRREALEAIGNPRHPFDESFPIFFNEVDLLFRLRQAGWNCLYTPAAHVIHHGGESTKQARPAMIWESHRSLIRYLRKHSGTTAGRLGLLLLAPLIYAAAFVRAKGYHAGFRT